MRALVPEERNAHDSGMRSHDGWTALAVLVMAGTGSSDVAAQGVGQFRMIVRSGVTCHTIAHPEAPVVNRYRTGDVIMVGRDTAGDRGTWLFDRWRVKGIAPTCWVRADLTVPSEARASVDALVRVADHVLARTDKVSFEELVEVINLIDAPVFDSPPLTQRTGGGLLSFRRLQLVERASDHLDRWMIADKPLHRAWVIAQDSVLVFFDPHAKWYVPSRLYWDLSEKYKTERWADAAAWQAAKSVPGVEECYASCFLELIAGSPQRYWTAFPQGDSVSAALDLALKLGRNALQQTAQDPPTRAQLNAMRASLVPVNSPRKAELLQLIQRLEAIIPRN